MKLLNDLTADYVRSRLSYNPDTGVFVWLNGRKMSGKVAGSKKTRGYIEIKLDGRLYQAHRLAWLITTGEWPTKEIDHVNGVRDDNRLLNLRQATRSENCQNRTSRPGSTSKFLGVSWFKDCKKWVSYIQINGKRTYLGLFEDEKDAARAYDTAARKHYSEFANPNFTL